jgi:predicted MFS family arabinose efflux permease
MAFDQPTRQAIIPRIVPREVLANAVALNSAANNVMRILGGALAGLLLIFFDFGDLYLIQSLMCLWVLFCIYQIKANVKSESKKQQGSMWSELMEGFSLARNDKAILYVLLLSLCLFVFAMPYQGLFVPLIAVENLDIGRSGVGMLIAVTGAGALCGSLILATIGDSLTKRGLVMFGLVGVYLFGLLLFANAGSLVLAVPALLITGASQTSFMSLNHTFVLGRAPPELHGRVISLFSLDRGLLPLGAILGGVLAEALGPQVALSIMASICLVCAAAIFTFVPLMRKIA